MKNDKYQIQYRIPSARWQSWDYHAAAAYFITICTANREQFFGHIENGVMQLTELGNICEREWIKTPDIRPDMNLTLDAFIVMPNHFHGIIVIGDNQFNADENAIQIGGLFAPQAKNLASILRGFKSAVTSHARKCKIVFDWHTRFHDHVFRNATEFEFIRDY